MSDEHNVLAAFDYCDRVLYASEVALRAAGESALSESVVAVRVELAARMLVVSRMGGPPPEVIE